LACDLKCYDKKNDLTGNKMANSNLTDAKNEKNDEFYTQYHDIEKEIAAYLEFNPDVFRDKTVLNKSKIWKLAEMDADHVDAWSKGGETKAKNCQMLCKTHNRAKGNR